jgi:proteasome lid subunit RPN8/RPN11
MVMEELRVAAEEGFQKIPHGGIEIGAILLGTHDENTVRVLEWRPMECEHARGPGFVMSERDLAAVETLMAQCVTAPELRGLEVVGWFHTHTRSKVFLSPDDLALFNRFFPQPWQVSLVMRVTKDRAPSAGFFPRGADGLVKCDSTPEFAVLSDPAALLGPTRMTALRKGGLSRRDVRPIRAAAAGDAEPQAARGALPEAAAAGPRAVPIPIPLPAPEETRFPWKWIGIAASAILALASVVAVSRGWLRTDTPQTASLRLEGVGNQVLVRWDHGSYAVMRAERGTVLIMDGSARKVVELNLEDVQRGMLVYQRQSEDVEVRLELTNGVTVVAREVARYLGPPLPARAPGKAGSAEQKDELDRIKAESEKLRQALAEEEKRGKDLQRDIRRVEGQLRKQDGTK